MVALRSGNVLPSLWRQTVELIEASPRPQIRDFWDRLRHQIRDEILELRSGTQAMLWCGWGLNHENDILVAGGLYRIVLGREDYWDFADRYPKVPLLLPAPHLVVPAQVSGLLRRDTQHIVAGLDDSNVRVVAQQVELIGHELRRFLTWWGWGQPADPISALVLLPGEPGDWRLAARRLQSYVADVVDLHDRCCEWLSAWSGRSDWQQPIPEMQWRVVRVANLGGP